MSLPQSARAFDFDILVALRGLETSVAALSVPAADRRKCPLHDSSRFEQPSKVH